MPHHSREQDIKRRLDKFDKKGTPVKLTEKFFKTYEIAPEPEINSVRFLDVKDRIKPPEEVPYNPSFLDKILGR